MEPSKREAHREELREAWKCQMQCFSHLWLWLMFIYPWYSVIHQSERLQPKVNTQRGTWSQRLAVGIELLNVVIGLILKSQKSVPSFCNHEHVGDIVINDTTKSTKLMRGENLMLWLIVERFVKVGNNVLLKKSIIFFFFYFLNNIFKFVLFLFHFICI